MTHHMLITGETVTSAQLSRWRHEFDGAFVDPRGCLLLRAGDDINWFALNAHMAFRECNDSFAGEMTDGLGGYLPRGASVREFIAAARRLKEQRDESDARAAHERAEIESEFAERRRVERACAGAAGSGNY